MLTTASTVLRSLQAWYGVGAHLESSWPGRVSFYSPHAERYGPWRYGGGLVVRPHPGGQARLLHTGPCVNIHPATAPFRPSALWKCPKQCPPTPGGSLG